MVEFQLKDKTDNFYVVLILNNQMTRCAQIAVAERLAFRNRHVICWVLFGQKTATDLFNGKKFQLHSRH